MYSAVHGSIGIVAGSATYVGVLNLTNNFWLAFGVSCFVAFLLHDPTDRLGEHGLGKYFLAWEVVPFAAMMFLGWKVECFWLYLAWYTSGNIMDLVDKKLYLSILFPSKFKPTYHFRCHRRERKKIIPFTLKETQLSQVLSVCLVLLTTIVIKILFR